MKKISILMLLLVQWLFVCAQQVEINAGRSVAYVPATISARTMTAEGNMMKAPQRALAATERGVGYCQGDSITTNGARIGTAGSYDMAAMLTSQTMANYKGCKIVGVRFAVAESIGKSNIFIYKVDELGNAEELVRSSVRRTSEGWNDVRLNSAQEIEITGDDQYIMGFTYNESEEMAAANKGALCFYGDKVSSSYSALILQNETFNSITNLGDLCVQLIIDVSSLPKKVIGLNSILNGTSYKKIGSKMDIMMSYTNAGLESINSLRLGLKIDDGEPTYFDINGDNNKDFKDGFAPGKSTTFATMFDMPSTTAVGRHNLNIFVDQIDGETPVATERGTLADPFVAYNNGFERQQSYIEQYNSQNNYLAPFVNDYYSLVDKDQDACVVNIYQRGEPLAVESSLYLNDLYAYTTPCSTSNRFFYGMGERHYAFDINDYAQIMPSWVYDGIRVFVDEAKSFPSFASVYLKTSFDNATRQVSVDVDGDIADEAPAIFGDMALTVMLAEDNVVGKQVVYNSLTGGASTTQKYVHNQVLRTYLTAATGDKINVEGNKYSAHYSYTLPAGWKDDDIKVVAFVTKAFDKVTTENMQMADVTNCNSVKLGNTTAIKGVATSDALHDAADGIYTLDGVKVSESDAAKGIYIIRHNGKSHKVVR